MPDISLVRKGSTGRLFYVIAESGNAEKICEKLISDISVAAVSVADWNRELSPWPAEKCFKNGEDFGGGAGEYLAELAAKIPAFEEAHGLQPDFRALCGYSLAGLAAVYALYLTDMFSGAVSASGSMWFDGWIDFMENNRPMGTHVKAYLSVGDREARTRNARLAAVEECTRRACGILNDAGEAMFELNPGNHFNEPDQRLARGMDRLFDMLK